MTSFKSLDLLEFSRHIFDRYFQLILLELRKETALFRVFLYFFYAIALFDDERWLRAFQFIRSLFPFSDLLIPVDELGPSLGFHDLSL